MLDLRKPIGWYFIINAVLLVGVGLMNSKTSTVALGDQQINLNLIWGTVMGVFGLFMACLSYLDRSGKDTDN